jgi:branched-chain amino acid aminotransferase
MPSGKPPIFYVNGDFVPKDHARISATDLAILRGLGVFESLRTYGGEPFRMPDHLARLRNSAEAVGILVPWTDKQLCTVVDELLAINKLPEAAIRLVVTGGESEDYFHPSGKPGLIIMTSALRPFSPDNYKKGVKVATAKMERFFPEAKTINYLPGVVAMQHARKEDPEIVEVLFIDRFGYVTEGTTSNCFAFIGGRLVTPGEKILNGVTRQVVLELAADRFPVDIRNITLQEFRGADEVFLTGSVKEILPVNRIDGEVVGRGACGARTQQLLDAFKALIMRLTS